MQLDLRELTATDETAFLKANADFQDPKFTFAPGYRQGMKITDYLDHLKKHKDGVGLPADLVPSTLLFGFAAGEVVGRLWIRHYLNGSLLMLGGHIGYGVVPSFRKKGYATEMLRLSLPIARSLGITRALLTCDDSNLGSSKTIERCGGVLENVIEHPTESGLMKRRYWIDLLDLD